MVEGSVDKIDVGVDLKYELIVNTDYYSAPRSYTIVIPSCKAPGLMSS